MTKLSMTGSGNRVVIDGCEYFPMSSVEFARDGTVLVDGVAQVDARLPASAGIAVIVETVSGSVYVTGDVECVRTGSGNVTAGRITGRISTLSGNISVGGDD